MKQELLVDRFVACFEKLGDGRPVRVSTEFSSLEPIYSRLPTRFPPLFERLVLSYRWAEVDLRSYRLLANPPGTGLGGLLQEMSKDSFLWKCLLDAGYIQFAKGYDVDYDPVCFDISSSRKSQDRKIVKIDHEHILCNNRVKIVAELAPNFEQLMLQTINIADRWPTTS